MEAQTRYADRQRPDRTEVAALRLAGRQISNLESQTMTLTQTLPCIILRPLRPPPRTAGWRTCACATATCWPSTTCSFATSCGACVALIGPNGAGKSTLLKAIAGLAARGRRPDPLARHQGRPLEPGNRLSAAARECRLAVSHHRARRGADGPLPAGRMVAAVFQNRRGRHRARHRADGSGRSRRTARSAS